MTMDAQYIVSWLMDKADRAPDPSWPRMMKAAAMFLKRYAVWTSLDDQYPGDGIVVLLSDGNQCDTGMYDAVEDAFDVDHAFIDPCEIIQWRYLPMGDR